MGRNLLLIIFFAMTLAMGSNSSESYTVSRSGYTQFSASPHGTALSQVCYDKFGLCLHEMESLAIINRRNLAQKQRYISYGALKKDSVPCKRRGNSYYDCERREKANPYSRGCSAVTHCARDTD